MNAAAFVVGPREGSGAALYDLAIGVGFTSVQYYRSVAEAERQATHIPLCFFLFAEVADLRRPEAAAQAIRFAGGRRVRFSPLIYFCRNPSVEIIRRCVAQGFDDVITAPFSLERIAPRLMRQIDTELVYYETSSYFGPDRRRQFEELPGQLERRGEGQYRRLEIVRHVATGVNVLRDDQRVVL
ncbi:MAG: hypothetical protein P4M09_08435 [Devosia sp.]|nr:hypothetical protein [Devosia sp.]